jgi:hypothetical protein
MGEFFDPIATMTHITIVAFQEHVVSNLKVKSL